MGSTMHALRSERNPTISSMRHPTNQRWSIAVVDVMSRSVTAPRKGASVNASREGILEGGEEREDTGHNTT